MADYLTAKELETIPRRELNDTGLFQLAYNIYGLSAYQIFTAAWITNHGSAYTNHIDSAFSSFCIMGRAPDHVRKYTIDCLIGKSVMLMDESAKDGALLA